MSPEQKQALADYVDSLNLRYEAKFVPQSQSRNKDEKHRSLNWRVKLSGAFVTIETDYMQGIAHLPQWDKISPWANRMGTEAGFRTACNEGKWPRTVNYETVSRSLFAAWIPIPAPALLDVLYSLCADSSVLDYPNFESWAGDYGYDTDSRTAEATYRACLDIGLRFNAMLGTEKLARLRELFQDY